jgi:hypothetical protein
MSSVPFAPQGAGGGALHCLLRPQAQHVSWSSLVPARESPSLLSVLLGEGLKADERGMLQDAQECVDTQRRNSLGATRCARCV